MRKALKIDYDVGAIAVGDIDIEICNRAIETTILVFLFDSLNQNYRLVSNNLFDNCEERHGWIKKREKIIIL